MQVQTAVRETVVAVTTLDLLILRLETLDLLWRGVTLATAFGFVGALACEKEDAHTVTLLAVFATIVIVAIDASRTIASCAVFAHFHTALSAFSTLKMEALAVVQVVLSSRHGEDIGWSICVVWVSSSKLLLNSRVVSARLVVGNRRKAKKRS